MKPILASLLVFLCCNVSSASTLIQESSWHVEEATVEDFGGGKRVSSGVSSDDLSLIQVGHIVCGRFDSTVGRFQPKSDSAVFVGFQTANRGAHVYLIDEWWGKSDPGEADITQRGTTLRWAMTHAPRHGYLDPNAKLRPAETGTGDNFLEALRLGCATIASDLGEVNQNNAFEGLKKLRAILSIK